MLRNIVRYRMHLILAVLVLNFACGKGPDATDQSIVGIEQNNASFNIAQMALNEESFSAVFSGSTIIWQANPNVKKVANISRVSTKLMDNGVQQLDYIDAKIAPRIAEFKSNYNEAQKIYKDFTNRSYQSTLMAAATWFAGSDGTGGQIKAIAQQLGAQHQVALGAADFQQAGQNFAIYCQAKLWERAVHKRFIDAKYRGTRPTPSGMCEGVYQKLGLLNRQAAVCQASDDYRNYFACLWHEGVKKTQLWSMRYPVGSDARNKLDALSDIDLQRLFREHNAGVFLLAQDSLLNIDNFNNDGALNIDFRFTAGAHAPIFATVKKIIENVELIADPDDKFRFIPIGDRVEGAADFIGEANRNLRLQLKQFNLMAAHFYINENKFNVPFQQLDPQLADIRWSATEEQRFGERFPSIAISSDPQVVPLQQQFLAKKAELLGIGAKIKELSAELDPAKQCAAEAKTLGCNYAEIVKDAQTSVNGDDVSVAVWQSDVAISEDAKAGILTARIRLQKSAKQVYWGCAAIKPGAICPQIPDPNFLPADIAFDPNLGGISIRIALKNLADSGLSPSPRSEFTTRLSFSAIPESRLAENTLELKGYFGVVGQKLRVLIGDVQVLNNDERTMYQGAIKYRDELPPQLKMINEFKQLAASLR